MITYRTAQGRAQRAGLRLSIFCSPCADMFCDCPAMFGNCGRAPHWGNGDLCSSAQTSATPRCIFPTADSRRR